MISTLVRWFKQGSGVKTSRFPFILPSSQHFFPPWWNEVQDTLSSSAACRGRSPFPTDPPVSVHVFHSYFRMHKACCCRVLNAGSLCTLLGTPSPHIYAVFSISTECSKRKKEWVTVLWLNMDLSIKKIKGKWLDWVLNCREGYGKLYSYFPTVVSRKAATLKAITHEARLISYPSFRQEQEIEVINNSLTADHWKTARCGF